MPVRRESSANGIESPWQRLITCARSKAQLYGPPPPPAVTRPQPDWTTIHRELRNRDVTLQLLWLEYKQGARDGFQYSQFCRLYREWQKHLDVVMRQEHRAGEKLFVDFAGRTIPNTDPITGEIMQAELFVAVLGASNYTYAEALPSQELPHWITAHVHAFEFLGCVPSILVCDNLRSGGDPLAPLRARAQPHLPGDGGLVLGGHHPGSSSPASQQGQGGGRRAHRRALDPGSPPAPPVLLPR
jgi:transposase